MKKMLTLIAAIWLLTSCSKEGGISCTTCTEKKSGYSQEYCGTPLEVKSFKETLIRQGGNVGQSWSCK